MNKKVMILIVAVVVIILVVKINIDISFNDVNATGIGEMTRVEFLQDGVVCYQWDANLFDWTDNQLSCVSVK